MKRFSFDILCTACVSIYWQHCDLEKVLEEMKLSFKNIYFHLFHNTIENCDLLEHPVNAVVGGLVDLAFAAQTTKSQQI